MVCVWLRPAGSGRHRLLELERGAREVAVVAEILADVAGAPADTDQFGEARPVGAGLRQGAGGLVEGVEAQLVIVRRGRCRVRVAEALVVLVGGVVEEDLVGAAAQDRAETVL